MLTDLGDMQEAIKEQLGGKSYLKLNEQGSIFLVPGENLDQGVLCGTNCFAIGVGPKRYLIDACKKDHEIFLNNLTTFCQEQNCSIGTVFITHAHYDHMDGAQNIVDLMVKLGHKAPKVHKFIDRNASEIMRYENNPGLENNMVHTKEGDVFVLEDELNIGREVIKKIELHPINTPGHMSDHLCFLMKELRQKSDGTAEEKHSLFTGDHIVGASSTYFTDYPQYFDSLVKT